ncbi:ATP-binding protein [Candidatus Electronema sp. JC]|uniref:sensor histidine kinase n=1 Tax=Candidatus Electronema sp. JC TaxID=3401570 RepID=UPI003B42CD50
MKTLLWKLCSSYFLLAALSLALCLAAASLLLKQSVISQAQDELAAQARLLRVRLERQEAAAYGGICAEFSAALGSRFTVISASGQVLADSEKDPLSFDNHADRPEILAALAGAVGVSRRRSHSLGKELLYVAVPLRRNGEIWGAARAALPAELLDERLAYLRGTLLLATVPALLLAAAASFFLALRVSRPLQEIEQGVLRFTQGSLRHRIRITGPLEITNLAESCNRMAAQLDERSGSLQKQLALLESTFRSMAEAVIVLDPEGRIRRCNQAAGRLFGFDTAAAEQRDIQEMIRLADVQQFFEKTMQQGGGATEGIITISTGREKTLSANGARLRSESGANAGALLVFHDITRLKRLETMRRDFAANVSHELKTPITAISGFVETLRDGALHEPDAERFLEIIARNVQRLRTIIEDLLALARLEQEEESGQISLSWKAVRPVLENAAAICANAAAEKSITLELDCPDSLRAKLNAPLLEQAVVNLLDNAVKYSSSQKSRVILRAAQEQGGMLIVVQDFGCGIAREHHARLFERFYRVDKARSCKLGGTGLGLAIVKHIVQAHHGAVSVESAPGRGSVFTVRLPG